MGGEFLNGGVSKANTFVCSLTAIPEERRSLLVHHAHEGQSDLFQNRVVTCEEGIGQVMHHRHHNPATKQVVVVGNTSQVLPPQIPTDVN